MVFKIHLDDYISTDLGVYRPPTDAYPHFDQSGDRCANLFVVEDRADTCDKFKKRKKNE